MDTADLDYTLPPRLIAKSPSPTRDASRLLVCSRSDPSMIAHHEFSHLPTFLRAGDLLVRNTTAVLPARILTRRTDTEGRVEGLFLNETAPGTWRTMLKSNGKLRSGQSLALDRRDASPATHHITLIGRDAEAWIVQLTSPTGEPLTTPAPEVLDLAGLPPLPPYILRSRPDRATTDADRDRYQTVYADSRARQSVAAPTAGLHFTPELLARIKQQGIFTTDLQLHVGAGTFKPVEADRLEDHPMHSERIAIPSSAIHALERCAKEKGRRIIVGTTTLRAIESLPHPLTDDIRDKGYRAETNLLIQPGDTLRYTDALITNFHLPRSTLLALVAALFPQGIERIKEIYALAIEEKYRFYSYGDAMLILP